MLYRVCWRWKTTGKSGNGEPVEHSEAQFWVDRCNREYPDIDHWIEAVEGRSIMPRIIVYLRDGLPSDPIRYAQAVRDGSPIVRVDCRW